MATATAATEESPGRVQPPSHHAQGFSIPFGHTPHPDYKNTLSGCGNISMAACFTPRGRSEGYARTGY